MTTWQKEETSKLIEIWADDWIQLELEGYHRNKDVYVHVLRKMCEAGYSGTFEQCHKKNKKLKKEYHKIKDATNETGQGRRKEWAFYDAMDAALGHKLATAPSVVVDTIANSESHQNVCDDDEFDEDKSLLTAHNKDTSTTSLLSDTIELESSNTESTFNLSHKKKNKKMKRGKSEQYKMVMDGFVKQLIDAQHKNEERYIEVEEKRMRFEERLLEDTTGITAIPHADDANDV